MKEFDEFLFAEMQVPTQRCMDVIYHLYLMLRGSQYKNSVEFNWRLAIDMMKNTKKFIKECEEFNMNIVEESESSEEEVEKDENGEEKPKKEKRKKKGDDDKDKDKKEPKPKPQRFVNFERMYPWKVDFIKPKQDITHSDLHVSPVDEQVAYPYSKTLALICAWITHMVEASRAFKLYEKEKAILDQIVERKNKKNEEVKKFEMRITEISDVIAQSEQLIRKDEDQMNLEKDDTDFLEQVLEQLTNPNMDQEKKINIESYECIDWLHRACKNEKLQQSLMCSVGNCSKIFGGVSHLKHHYRTRHPGAIFEVDFPNSDSIAQEQERIAKFLYEKKQWIKTDVEFARQKFVKKNTQFRMMSDDFKEHADYDELHQKFRIYERKSKDIDFYSESQQTKMKFAMAAKKNIISSGQLELSLKTKAVKSAYKQLKAIKDDELKEVLEIIEEKGSTIEMKNIEYEVEIDESRRYRTYTQRGEYRSIKPMLDPERNDYNDYWMTGFVPGETYVIFKFKEPVLVSQFTMIYQALDAYRMDRGASDPKEWILKIKNAYYPYAEFEIPQKSKYYGGCYDRKPKHGEKEIFEFGSQYLTQEIKIVFTKIRDYDYETYCQDVAMRGMKFMGATPKFIQSSDELDASISALDKLKDNEFKLFQQLTEPKSHDIKACQMMCILLNNMPSTAEFKDLRRYKGDTKRFFSKTLATSMKNFDQLKQDLQELDVDQVDAKKERKIRSILNSEEFKEENLKTQNQIVLGISNWARASLNYSAGLKKSKKLFTPKEMGMLKKAMKCYIIMISEPGQNLSNKEVDLMIKEQMNYEQKQHIVKNFDFKTVTQTTLRAVKRLRYQFQDHEAIIEKANPTIHQLCMWQKSILEYFEAKVEFDQIGDKNNYLDHQIRTKENEIKRLKEEKVELNDKIETLKEDETVLKKNLIVKNKNWVLEGCMKVLLEDGCNPNITDNSGETLLIHTIKKNKLNALELLLNNDCKITTRNAQGMSAFGQAVTSMNCDALIKLLKTDVGKSMVHEPQIFDKQISHKILTPVHYLCKIIRLKGLKPEYKKMIDTIQGQSVKCQDLAEKEGVFRQFGRLFSTITVDMNPNTLKEIMNIYKSFMTDGSLLNLRDRKKNNFLHLISKNLIYEKGDTAHSNYKFIISEHLSEYSEDGNYREKLKNLIMEQNYDGVSPMTLMLENNQYSLVKILCEQHIIDNFFPEQEEQVVQYILRFAQTAQDLSEFNPRVQMFKNHFATTEVSVKSESQKFDPVTRKQKTEWITQKIRQDRLVPMIRARGKAMVKKIPSLEKQFNKLTIVGKQFDNNDEEGGSLMLATDNRKKKKKGKKGQSKVQAQANDNNNDDNQEDEEEEEDSEDSDNSKNLSIESDSDEENAANINLEDDKNYERVSSLVEFVRVQKSSDQILGMMDPTKLKEQRKLFELQLHKEIVSYDYLPKEKKLNEYIEFMFNLFLETIALFDLSGDLILLVALFNSEHTAWFSLSLLSCLSPFFVCYVPLLTFQKKKLNNKDVDVFTAFSMFIFLTPLVLIYLQGMDIIYIINSVGLVPIAVLIQLFSCGMLKGNMAHMFEEKLDSIYEVLFGMSQMDIKGFRRLRTISQLSFESMPQILIQGRILYYNVAKPESTQHLEVDMRVIVGSLACAFFHAIIEAIFVNLEAKACKTTFSHYCIVCFNARFGWIPFQNLFAAGGEDDSNVIDYENIRNSLLGQEFDVDFAFSKSTAQVLIKCISQLPTETNELKRKNVYIGSSMNDVDMDKLIDLVEMANKRVNLFIDGIDVVRLLNRDDSKHILENIRKPDFKDGRHDSLMIKLIELGRSHIVKQMSLENPKTDLVPKPFQVAVDSRDFEMCKTLINLNDENINKSIAEINNNQCKFEEYLKLGIPSITAALFSKRDWLICESYQYLIFQQIMDSIRERDIAKSFNLLKALCGPNIPVHLIRGIGMSRTQQRDRPSAIDARRKYQDEYRQHKPVLLKFQQAFPSHVYVITKAPQFGVGEAGETKCLKQYIPFASTKDLSEDQKKDKTYKDFVGKQLKQKLKLTSEEAYSFCVIRQMLLNEPLEVDRSKDDKSIEEERIGQIHNPLDLSEFNLDPFHIKLVAQLITLEEHMTVPSLTKEDIQKCDEVVQVLMLDRQRATYFARSRLFDQTEQKPDEQIQLYKDERYYFDAHWKDVANLNQVKYNQMVLHPFLEKYRVANADLRWIQVLYEYTVPKDVIAIKSFHVEIESYRAVISLNIIKPQYQTSYIISNDTDTGENFNDSYPEVYHDRGVRQDELPVPDGFKDVISSVESGDTIKILMSRTRTTMKEENSSYVKNFKVTMSLVTNHGVKAQSGEPKSKNDSESKEPYAQPKNNDELMTEELVITTNTKIRELKVKKHRKIFQLLDFFEHSRLKRAEDLDYFESFFFFGNTSELSKSLTAKIWSDYKNKICEGKFSFKQCIYPGIEMRDSKYGVQAYTQYSYSAFSQLFDNIIFQIHQKDSHIKSIKGSENNKVVNEKQAQKDLDYEQQQTRMIHSIKCGIKRNISGFPLCPGFTPQQRIQVMQNIKKACNNLQSIDIKLKGVFVEIKDLTEDQKAKLGPHVFSITDKFHKTCGFENDWPNGRALFFNEDLTLVIKINWMDHIDIEYSQMTISTRKFFEEKFLKISSLLEDQLGFSIDERLGYVTALPENLGSAMRTEIVINVPNLMNTDIERSEADIQTHRAQLAEYIEFKDHVLNIKDDGSDIGNSLKHDQVAISSIEKLGISIDDAILNLKESTNCIIDKENMVLNKLIINLKGRMSNYEHLFVKKVNKEEALLQKYLTKPVWDKYKEKTTKDGVKFIDCVYPGIKEPNSKYLICAGSKGCYEEFPELFNPFIKRAFGHDADQDVVKSEMNFLNMKDTEFKKVNLQMIEKVKMSVLRNFEGFNLGPSGISKQDREEIFKIFKDASEMFKFLDTEEHKYSGTLTDLSKPFKDNKYEKLSIYDFVKEEFDKKFIEAAQLDKHWPAGGGIFNSQERNFSAEINIINQLRLILVQEKGQRTEEHEEWVPIKKKKIENQSQDHFSNYQYGGMQFNKKPQVKAPQAQKNTQKKKKAQDEDEETQFEKKIISKTTDINCDIFKAFQNLCMISHMIEQKRKFLYSDKLGYLTSFPRDLGIFQLQVHLRMPVLLKLIQSAERIENFIHYDVFKKHQIDFVGHKEGLIEIMPMEYHKETKIIIDRVQKEDYFDEPISCEQTCRPGFRKFDRSHSYNSQFRTNHNYKSYYRFSRYRKNEKQQAQDMISCVKELTDLETFYNDQDTLFNKYLQLNKQEDLEDFDSFFINKDLKRDGSNRAPYSQIDSKLSRVLTKEIWEEYKGQKCDMGFSFAMSIFPDIQRNNNYGLYAGSASAYQKFSKVFYKYIEEFHNFEPNSSKVPASEFKYLNVTKNIDATPKPKMHNLIGLKVNNSFLVPKKLEIDDFQFTDAHLSMINKVHFKLRRNLKNLPFVDNMTHHDRVRLMLQVIKVTDMYKAELGGQFYRLLHLKDRDKEKLAELMIKQDMTKMKDAERKAWDYGRGIYANKDRSFAINVGILDHMMISAYQFKARHKLCDIKKAFKLLMKGVAHLDEHLEFAFDENIGYTTQWIADLGVIDLCVEFQLKYYKYYKDLMTQSIIADKYKIDLEVKESSMILRNINKFGMTESDIFIDLLKCLQEFFRLEDQFSQKYSQRMEVERKIPKYISKPHDDDLNEEDLDQNKEIGLIDWSDFEAQIREYHQSLLLDRLYSSKLTNILTPEIWDEYSGQVCKEGFAFKDSFVEPIQQYNSSNSHRKIVAGSADAYRKFRKFFANCLKEFGNVKAEAFEQDKYQGTQAQAEFQNTDFEAEDEELIKEFKITVRRNLKGYPLAAALSNKQREEIRDKVINACKKVLGNQIKIVKVDEEIEEPKPKKQSGFAAGFYSTGGFGTGYGNWRQKQELKELREKMCKAENGNMLNRGMYTGRTYIESKDQTIKVFVHDIDHVQFTLHKENKFSYFNKNDNQIKLKETIEEDFMETLKQLDAELKFEKDRILGYVTARPYDLGYTHIQISIELKDLADKSQDINDHVKGDFFMTAHKKERNWGPYEFSNTHVAQGKDEIEQIQNMFDYVQQVFSANRKYNEFNLITKVENVLGKEFDSLFPPRADSQPYIYEHEIITKEIWDLYEKGNKKCSFKKNLAACIFPGFKDKKNKMAICAMSPDSYNAFDLIFDAFIRDAPKQKEFVSGGYHNIEIDPINQPMVKKCSLKLSRNIKGFPLVPGISKEQRIEVMEIMQKCCEEFQDEWQGTFFKLESISESEKKIISNISQERPDEESFKGLANQVKDWPQGRAIFTNASQNLQIWVNFRDHIMINYFEENVSIQYFLDRVMEILRKIQLGCEFLFSEKHGYLTSYPYLLRMVQFQVMLDDSSNQISGFDMYQKNNESIVQRNDNSQLSVRNQSPEIDDIPAESEQKQIQNVINVVQDIFVRMKKQEDMRKEYDEQIADASKLKTYEVFMQKSDRFAKDLVTKDVWEDYHLMKCQLEIPFYNIVYPGILHPDDKYALCVSSLSCYKFYHNLFERYMSKYHAGVKRDAYHLESHQIAPSLYDAEFKQDQEDQIQKVQFKVRRNFAGIPLGPGQTSETRKLIVDIVQDLCVPLQGKFYKLDSITEQEKDDILMQGVEIGNDNSYFLELCKISDDWPNQRAIFVSQKGDIAIKVNFLDHLEICYTAEKQGFMEAYANLNKLLTHLQSKEVVQKIEDFPVVMGLQGETPDDLNLMKSFQTGSQVPKHKLSACKFAFDERLGYITTLPRLINQFKLTIWLNTHKDMNIDEYKDLLVKHGFQWINGYDGINDDQDQFASNIIRNQTKFAITEQVQIQSTINLLQSIFQQFYLQSMELVDPEHGPGTYNNDEFPASNAFVDKAERQTCYNGHFMKKLEQSAYSDGYRCAGPCRQYKPQATKTLYCQQCNYEFCPDCSEIDAYTQTDRGQGAYWQAQFKKPCHVTQVKIKNRGEYGERLANTLVYIGKEHVGTLPSTTRENKWYSIKCKTPKLGSFVRLVKNNREFLSIQSIVVYTSDNQEKEQEHLRLTDINDYLKMETFYRKGGKIKAEPDDGEKQEVPLFDQAARHLNGDKVVIYGKTFHDTLASYESSGMKLWMDTRTQPDGSEYHDVWAIDEDRSRYKGFWKYGKKHGRGVHRLPNGNYYDGEFRYNVRHGFGVGIYSDGSMYVGQWKNGRRDGYGIHKRPDSSSDYWTHKGIWKNDVEQGFGVSITPYSNGGNTFKGPFVDGKLHGFGAKKEGNGAVFVGEWKRGTLHGLGMKKTAGDFRFKDGLWYEGKEDGWLNDGYPEQ